jgi:cell division protein FtsQ
VWDNPRLLNSAAGLLVGLAALGFALAGAQQLLRSGLFPVMQIDVRTPLANTTKDEIEAATRGRVRGNLFAVELAEVRSALEGLPWVRHVAVRRVWPDRLEVRLEEHVALARWGDEALVNTYGERFAARTDEALPVFIGPAGSEREMARRYRRFAMVLVPLGTAPDRVVLSARHAWQLRLENGLNVMLGRDAELAEGRLARFVAVYPETLGRMARSHEYVDLRYPNGFSLRVPELQG